MSDTERLAAYLVGELDADQRAAVEAALSRDPALRARLDALRRTDDALSRLGAVEPRAGFSERLRSSVRDEVARLERARNVSPLPRRRRFTLPGWLVPAAAAALVLIVGGVVVGDLVGSGDGADVASAPDDEAGGDQADTMMMAQENLPVVVARDRSYDADSLPQAADAEVLDRFATQRLPDDEAVRIAREYARSFGIPPDAADPATNEAPDAGEGGAAELESAPGVNARIEGQPTSEELSAVTACLPQLFTGASDPLIPAYAEIATYEGQEAIVYGLVTDDPDSGAFDRVELWVVHRDDCFILHQRILSDR